MSPAVKCSQCRQKCDRALIDGTFRDVKICRCGYLYCGSCADAYSHTTECACRLNVRLEFPLLSKYFTLLNVAPNDQMDIIDLQVCRIRKCSVCDSDRDELSRSNIQHVFCYKCNILQDHVWSLSSKTEYQFMEILNTLPKVRWQRPGAIGKLPIRITNLYCKSCEEDIWAKNNISCRPFIIDGETYCYDCGGGIYVSKPELLCCLCLYRFAECIGCIPENQLYRLTYSKWVKAIGCELHENILNELTAVSSDDSRRGKLRSFFKGGDFADDVIKNKVDSVSGENKQINNTPVLDSATTSTAARASKELTSELSTLDIPTSDKVEPLQDVDLTKLTSVLSTLDMSTPVPVTTNRIVCLCGREEDISDVFVCKTCSVYGVCALCTTRNHWGHDVQDTVKASEKAFKKLCTILGAAFADAATNSDNQQRIQPLLEKSNTSTLEKYFKDAVNSTKKLHRAIDNFCDDLTDTDSKQGDNI